MVHHRLSASPPRLLILAVICASILLIPTYLSLSRNGSLESKAEHQLTWAKGSVLDSSAKLGGTEALKQVVKGGVIMPQLKNATLKAELGRSSWKLLHTMAQRFPETPSHEEREAYESFVYLFSRLYPCGECAEHFQTLLKKFPPQTSSRTATTLHMCMLHNHVNERLGKPEFDCSTLDYDCGCGPEESGTPGSSGMGQAEATGIKKLQRIELDEFGLRESEDDGEMRDPRTGQRLVGG